MLTYAALLQPIRPTSPPPLLASQQGPSHVCSGCGSIASGFREISRHSKPTERMRPVDYVRLDFYPDFPNLKTSAEQGCACCALLRYSIRKNWSLRPFTEYRVGDLDDSMPLYANFLATEWDGQISIDVVGFLLSSTVAGQVTLLSVRIGPSAYSKIKGVRVIDDNHDTIDTVDQISAELMLKVYKASQPANPQVDLIDALRFPSVETLSKQNLEFVLSWLQDCSKKHVRCSFSGPEKLPTRVIDVGLSSPGYAKPYLLCSNGREGRYAALSHCWGIPSASNPGFKTQSHNYDSVQAGIVFESLPALFQDAMVTTRKLGIQYLWIDSICIIQDSKEDWEAESAKMSSVYRNAYVTIVATSATASNQSFLERSVDAMPVAKIPIFPMQSLQDPTFIYLSPRLQPREEGVWISDVVDSAWNRRGWCLQELMLSRRLLHFCKNKIYFECRSIIASEENELSQRSSPASVATESTGTLCLLPLEMSQDREPLLEDVQDTQDDVSSLSSGETLERWKTISQQYSRRQLTYSSDKLPALSGLASQYARLTDRKYLAGLWHEDLTRLLLWSMNPQIAPRPLPPHYRAPSWSWASLDGEVIMPSLRSSKLASLEVLEADTIPSGLDPFGAVKSGHLKVSGLMLKIDYIPEYNDFDRFIAYQRSRFPYDLQIKNGTDESIKVGECCLDRDDVYLLRPEIWYLEVFSDRSCIPTGLILQAANERKDEFVRVGIATMNGTVKTRYTTFSDTSVLNEAHRRTITIF